MSVFARALKAHLADAQIDSWVSFWGCVVGAVIVSCIAVALVSKHAANPVDLFLGIAAAFVTGLLLVLSGALARRVHRRTAEGRAPWRSRRWELLSYAVGLGVAGIGGRSLMSAAPGTAGVVTGALLLLSGYAVVLCPGCWATLARAEK